jgi:hypothetical protein
MAVFMLLADHPELDASLVPLWAFRCDWSTYLWFRFYGAICPVTNRQLAGRS